MDAGVQAVTGPAVRWTMVLGAFSMPGAALAQSAAVFRAEPDYDFSLEAGIGAQARAETLWSELLARFTDDPDLALADAAQAAAARRDVLAAMQAQSEAAVDCRSEGRDDCAPLSRGSAVLGRFYRDHKEVLEFAALAAADAAGAGATLAAAQAIAPVAMRLELTERLENIRAATPLRERAVAIYESEGGDVPWELIAAYFRLSDNYRSQRRFVEAATALEKAAVLADATWDFDAAVKGDLALQRAELYADMRRPAEAEQQVLKARKILGNWFEPYEQLPLEAEAAYARALLDANRLTEAEAVFEGMEKAIGERMGLPFEPVAVRLRLGRAELHERRGEPAQAEAIYRDIVARAVGFGVKDSPLVALALKRMAGSLAAQERFSEASATFDEALTMLVKTVGKPHPATADALLGYGRVLERQGDFGRARDLYDTALSYLAPYPTGLDHAILMGRRAGAMARLVIGAARRDEAFEAALATFAKALGDDPHPARALALHEWGAALWRSPASKRDGRVLMREARAMFARVADRTNLARIETLGEYAALLPRRDEAEAYSAIADATEGAVARMATYDDFGAGARAELRRFAPVFLTRVKLAWKMTE